MPAKKSAPAAKKSTRTPRKLLARYQEKRDFTQTPEPSGTGSTRTSSPRAKAKKSLAFCVQKHLATALHYDFRLEHDGVLLSWAVPKGPSLNPREKRLAMRVEDHPFDYRTFEGVIPSGYGAGVVMLWDEGAWTPDPGFEDVANALRRGELKFHLTGVKLNGGFVLVRTGGGTATGERERWLLMKHKDDHAGEIDVAAAAPRSVKSDRDFEGILKGDPDIWESHQKGTADELEKIVQKVAALAAAPKPPTAAAASRGAAPRKKSRRT